MARPLQCSGVEWLFSRVTSCAAHGRSASYGRERTQIGRLPRRPPAAKISCSGGRWRLCCSAPIEERCVLCDMLAPFRGRSGSSVASMGQNACDPCKSCRGPEPQHGRREGLLGGVDATMTMEQTTPQCCATPCGAMLRRVILPPRLDWRATGNLCPLRDQGPMLLEANSSVGSIRCHSRALPVSLTRPVQRALVNGVCHCWMLCGCCVAR